MCVWGLILNLLVEAQAVNQLVISLLVRPLCQFGKRISCNFCYIREPTRQNGGGFSHADGLANSRGSGALTVFQGLF